MDNITKLKKFITESGPWSEKNELRQQWTPCEEYGHRFTNWSGEPYSTCLDCGAPNTEFDHDEREWFKKHPEWSKEGKLSESKIAMKVKCPDCGAAKGKPCKTKGTHNSMDKRMTTIHSGRITLAKKVNESRTDTDPKIIMNLWNKNGSPLTEEQEDIIVDEILAHRMHYDLGTGIQFGIHPTNLKLSRQIDVFLGRNADRLLKFNIDDTPNINEGLLDFIRKREKENLLINYRAMILVLQDLEFEKVEEDKASQAQYWRKNYYIVGFQPNFKIGSMALLWSLVRNGKLKAKGKGAKSFIKELIDNNPEFGEEARQILANKSFMAAVNNPPVAEADIPVSAGFASPLSFPQTILGSKFHTRPEIKKHQNTTGKLSPFSLLNCEEKDVDDDDKEIQRLADLARGHRPLAVNTGGSGRTTASNNPLEL